MLTYEFSYKNPKNHIIDIQLDFISDTEITEICIPAWRPGRYELQNFAKNIIAIHAISDKKSLKIYKNTKDSWLIENGGYKKITINYQFFAFQMDAGGSWLDDAQLYINFINCAIYPKNKEFLPCKISLKVPENFIIATSLKQTTKNILYANSYYELVDSPMVASPTLKKLSYNYQKHQFHLWFQGNISLENNTLIDEFKKFTYSNMDIFGEFPCDEYHFLFQILPYKHYHGVEHLNSTMIVLGPDTDFNTTELKNNLLGVSCHELFHTWNVIRLRPKEMMPYRFQEPNYFNTGYVIEGITTYYGELLLARSKVFDIPQFLTEFNGILKNHFDNFGYYHSSLADSSIDAWIDGYQPNSINRRVSIYHKGALVAFLLDIELRKLSNHVISLDTIMKSMWEKFGKSLSGYLHTDFVNCVNDVSGKYFNDFFEKTVFGKSSLLDELKVSVEWLGCELEIINSNSEFERKFGARLIKKEAKWVVQYIEPNSPASFELIKDDEITAINGLCIDEKTEEIIKSSSTISIEFIRAKKKLKAVLSETDNSYFKQYKIKATSSNDNFDKWIKGK